MAEPTFDRKNHVFTEQNVRNALAKAIGEIKQQDGLPHREIGRVLNGVCEAQAAKYIDSLSTMSVFTFACGKREWGGRFTGYFDRLVLGSRPGSPNGQTVINHMLSAVSAINMATRDGELTARDIQEHRSTLEAARDQLDQVLSQLKLREAV